MVAIKAVLAFSAVAHGAAHLRPYNQNEVREAQPQFPGLGNPFGAVVSQISSLLNGFSLTLPSGFPTALPSTTATAVSTTKVTTTSATSVKTSTSAITSASSGSVKISQTGTVKSSAIVSSSSPSNSATSKAATSVVTSSSTVKPVTSTSVLPLSSAASSKPVSSSAASSASVKPVTTLSGSSVSVKTVSTVTGSSASVLPVTSLSGSSESVKPVTTLSGSSASVKTVTSLSGSSASVLPVTSLSGSSASIKPVTSLSGSSGSAKSASGSGASSGTAKSASGSVASSGSVKSATGSVASSGSVKSASGSVASAVSSSRRVAGCPASSRSSKSAASVSSGNTFITAPSPKSSSGVKSASVPVKSGSASVGSSAVQSSKTSASVGSSAAQSSKIPASSSKAASASVTKSSKAASGSPSVKLSISSASQSLFSSASSVSLTGPSATISAGVVVGNSFNGVDQFLGIPYAQPPVGALRLKPPVPYTGSFGVLNATTPPNACPQQAQDLTGNYSLGGIQPLFNEFVYAPTPQSEDCLTINVYRPNTTTPDSKLPVLFWIYGGGFEFGATSMFNGSNIVARSVSLGAPVIFVEVNYRLNGFGFLAGADLAGEVSTNLGLRDQRLGLQWNADNIAAFGGDASKVTLWGESAGAISTCYQLTVNGGNNVYNGKPLFRGSIHNSGSFAPADSVTAPQAQAIYDHVVTQTGCSASTAAERLSCLRSVDFATLQNATNSVPGFGGYRSADLSYLPRPDSGDSFYAQSAEYSVAAGQWTKTPFIIGDQQDEGTILAIVQNNITTNDDLVNYIATWFPGDKDAISHVQGLAALYPDDVAGGQPDGSPYNTGSNNNIYPQYKRLAAILGDIVFIITRRAFLNFGVGQGVNAWTYLATYLQGFATFGTLHGSDLAYLFDPLFVNSGPTVHIHTYYISFVNYLDPNAINATGTQTYWPGYNLSNPQYADFTGGDVGLGNDTFKHDVYDYLVGNVGNFRV